jgi:N-acetylglucosamine malate deacetylase 1
VNVVVIAPHPDDESIGCGGTICLHRLRRDRVVIVYLSSGELGLKSLPPPDARALREAEASAAAGVLDVSHLVFLRYPDCRVGEHARAAAVQVHAILATEKPGLVYLPHEHEGHVDHGAALGIVREALARGDAGEPTLLTYEVWTPLSDYYHVEDVTPVMGRKLEAIRCHRSQVAQLAYDRAVRGLNLYRGVTAGACRYAEIFQTAAREWPGDTLAGSERTKR